MALIGDLIKRSMGGGLGTSLLQFVLLLSYLLRVLHSCRVRVCAVSGRVIYAEKRTGGGTNPKANSYEAPIRGQQIGWNWPLFHRADDCFISLAEEGMAISRNL